MAFVMKCDVAGCTGVAELEQVQSSIAGVAVDGWSEIVTWKKAKEPSTLLELRRLYVCPDHVLPVAGKASILQVRAASK